ncbi:zinc finger, PMZ-type containing protein [Tanacetum coccineum]
MAIFTLNLYHDGVFVPIPLKYMEGGFKVVNDIQFEDMRIGDLFKVVTRLVLNPPKGLYYCLPGTTLTRGIRPLKTEKDMKAFIKVGFENGFKVELYTEYYDYDVMGYTNNDNLHRIDENIDEPNDVGKGNFIGSRDNPIPSLSDKYILEENDPDDNLIDVDIKIKRAVRSDNKSLLDNVGRDIELDSHKGLIEAVKTWLPQAEHDALHTSSRLISKQLQVALLFENGNNIVSLDSSKHSAIGKPIITMLEDIRVYIMQRIWHMSKKASACDDIITPSIRNHLEVLKDKQRKWTVFPSGYQVVEVRKRDEAYGVNLISRKCGCRLWNLSGVPCIHVVAAFMHFKLNPDIRIGVAFNHLTNTPPLPPTVKTMPVRPRKNRIKHPSELDDQHHVSRVGRVMTCQKCWRPGHNKSSCTNPRRDKPYETDIPPMPHKRCVNTTKVGKAVKEVRDSKQRWVRVVLRGLWNNGKLRKQATCRVMLGVYGTMVEGLQEIGENQIIKDKDAMHEVMQEVMDEEERLHAEKEQRLDSEREHNGRIYQDWDQVSQDELIKGSTLSVLEVVDEAIQEHNDGLPSISEGQFQSLNQASGNSEHPISQHAPTLLETTTEESHTLRVPRPRPQIMPRGKSERIAKKRKFNYHADGTGKTPDKPFSL